MDNLESLDNQKCTSSKYGGEQTSLRSELRFKSRTPCQDRGVVQYVKLQTHIPTYGQFKVSMNVNVLQWARKCPEKTNVPKQEGQSWDAMAEPQHCEADVLNTCLPCCHTTLFILKHDKTKSHSRNFNGEGITWRWIVSHSTRIAFDHTLKGEVKSKVFFTACKHHMSKLRKQIRRNSSLPESWPTVMSFLVDSKWQNG